MRISFNNIYPYNTRTQKPQQKGFQTRTAPINFRGKDLLLLPPEKIIDQVNISIRPKNLLDEGGEAAIYNIGDTNYCVRVPLESTGRNFRTISFNLTEPDKINHAVAKLNRKIRIMPIIKGVTYNSNLSQNTKVAQMIENMPQTAYDNLIEQICHAYNYKLEFDAGKKNIIINPKTKTMTAIDFYKPIDRRYRNKLINDIFHALISSNPNTIEQKKKCASKILHSVLKMFEPGNLPLTKLSGLGLPDFPYEMSNHKILKNRKDYDLFENLFEDLVKLKSEELQGKNVTSNLKLKLKLINKLIKQLLETV